MNDALDQPLDQALRDQAQPFRASTAAPAGGLDEAIARARSRRRTRRTVLSTTVVLALVVVAIAGFRLDGTDDVVTVPASPTNGLIDPTVTTVTTDLVGTTTVLPTSVVPTTVPPKVAPVTVPPTTTTPTTTPTTTTPAADPSIGPDGTLGVALGDPMDDAVARITSQIGPPDSDRAEGFCGPSPSRRVRWGALSLMAAPLTQGDRVHAIEYGGYLPEGSGQPMSTDRPVLLLGGQPFGGAGRPVAEVEATIRSTMPDLAGSSHSEIDWFSVWNAEHEMSVILGSGPAGTTMVGVSIYVMQGTDPC